MSDPMTNTEVEDVLSSIRRLVSDDKRADAPTEAPLASDRLVLTPALRVSDEADEKTEPAAETEAAVSASDTDAMVADGTTSATGPDGSEPEVAPAVNAQLDPADPLDVWSDDAITQERVAEPEQTAEDGPDAIVVDDAEVVGDIAESSQAAAVPPAPKDAEPVAPDAGQDHSEVSEQAVQTDPKPATDTATAETLSDKIAALETLIAGQNEQWEPDDAGTDPYAGTDAPSMAWEDAETAEIPPEEEAVHDIYEADPEPGPEPEAQIFASDEDVLDEDALRDLVADIVREELQGALGERITRNVRKLVRREIHRAFAAQDLE